METTNINSARNLLGFIGIGIMIFTQMGCDLDENPGGSQLAVTSYTTMEQLQLGITGAYYQVYKAAFATDFYINGWSGDDVTTHRASNKHDFREFDQRAVTSLNARNSRNWGNLYRAIQAANTVLASSEGLSLPDQATQNKLIGEAYFLRGIMFHHLTRMHGRIPLVLDLDPFFKPELPSQLEVYQQIESDLLKAESLLPVASNLGATHPNAGSARALLARLYLDWAGFPLEDQSKYAKAASIAKQVIDNADSHGFGLLADVGSLWSLDQRFNKESLFTIAFCENCGLYNRKYGKLGIPGDFSGWAETFAEIRFFEDFPEGPRKDATFHYTVPLNAKGKVTPDVAKAVKFLPWTEFKDQQSPIFRKVIGPWEDDQTYLSKTDRNDFYMRYAELLLIYAEASGEAGTAGGDAWDALNKVRRRAAGLPVNKPDPNVDLGPGDGAIQDLVFTERKWELAGEYLRWNDLVRKKKVEEALGGDARDPRKSIGTEIDPDGNAKPKPLTEPVNKILGSLGTDNYFAPIPQVEVEKNPNLRK